MVERDIRHMIANVQCLLPARLHTTRHVQLVWRHDNIFPTQANQVGVCFVLNDYSDDPDTSVYTVGQNVLLPTESAKQTPLTPTDFQPLLTSRKVVFLTIMPWMTTTNHV